MQVNRKIGYLGSAAIHGTALVLLLLPGCHQIRRPVAVPMEGFELDEKIGPRGDGYYCSRHYTGVGLKTSAGVIDQIADDYPASRAGMQVGDYVENIDVFFNQQLGIEEEVRVRRGDRKLVFHVKPETVCII